MTHGKFNVFVVLMGLILGMSGLKAETPKEEKPQNEGPYSHLWKTKDISAVEVSPDNKLVFVFYDIPEPSSSDNGDPSSWSSRFLIKRNYKDSSSSEEQTYTMEGLAVPRAGRLTPKE